MLLARLRMINFSLISAICSLFNLKSLIVYVLRIYLSTREELKASLMIIFTYRWILPCGFELDLYMYYVFLLKCYWKLMLFLVVLLGTFACSNGKLSAKYAASG
jgi:hypothetical protein